MIVYSEECMNEKEKEKHQKRQDLRLKTVFMVNAHEHEGVLGINFKIQNFDCILKLMTRTADSVCCLEQEHYFFSFVCTLIFMRGLHYAFS